MNNIAMWSLKLLLTAAIFVGIGWKLDVASVFKSLPSLSPYAIAAAFLLGFSQVLLAAARLSIVVSLFRYRLKLLDAFHVIIQSLFFAQTFASFIGSDALRIWIIQRCGAPLSEAIETVTLDRLMGIIVNHMFLLATLPWLLDVVDGAVRTALLTLAGAGIAGTAVVLILGMLQGRTGLTKRLAQRFHAQRFVPLLLQVSGVGRHFLKPSPALYQAAGLSLLLALTNSLIFCVILLGWKINFATAIVCALCAPAVLEIAMLPISVAGWGVREGVTIIAFGQFGVPPAIAFGTSVIFALTSLVVGVIGGVLWFSNVYKIRPITTLDP